MVDFGLKILTFKRFETKEIWVPEAMVSLYGIEGLGLGL